jgi:hypothetical protein
MALTVGTGINRAAARRAPVPTYRSPRVAERSGGRSAYRAPAKRKSSGGGGSSRNRGQVSQGYSRSGGGGGGGGGVRGVSSGASAGPVKPVAPNINSYLAGDTDYQNFLRGNKRTLGDFLNDLTRQRTEAGTTFATSKRQMETERERALEAMKDEFASRGLLTSGLYGEAQGDYNTDWTQQMGTLEQANSAFLADLLSQQTNFSREQQLATEAAKQEALRRRAERYGV